jgi:hypothetical protein
VILGLQSIKHKISSINPGFFFSIKHAYGESGDLTIKFVDLTITFYFYFLNPNGYSDIVPHE